MSKNNAKYTYPPLFWKEVRNFHRLTTEINWEDLSHADRVAEFACVHEYFKDKGNKGLPEAWTGNFDGEYEAKDKSTAKNFAWKSLSEENKSQFA